MSLTRTLKVRVSEDMYQRLEAVQKELFSEDRDKSRLIRVALGEWLQKVGGQSRTRPEPARRAPSKPVVEPEDEEAVESPTLIMSKKDLDVLGL